MSMGASHGSTYCRLKKEVSPRKKPFSACVSRVVNQSGIYPQNRLRQSFSGVANQYGCAENADHMAHARMAGYRCHCDDHDVDDEQVRSIEHSTREQSFDNQVQQYQRKQGKDGIAEKRHVVMQRPHDDVIDCNPISVERHQYETDDDNAKPHTA